MSIESVAEQLLLSTRQVRGLESGDAGAFHNADFYARALRKYARLLAVDPPLPLPPRNAVSRQTANATDAFRLTLAEDQARPPTHATRRFPVVVVATILAGALLLAGAYVF